MSHLSSQAHLRRRFSDAALSYGQLADIQFEVALQLLQRASAGPTVRVLDIGAGDGAMAAILSAGGAEVVALDAAWGMVEAGRRKASGAAWVQADAARLPFRQGTFDLVCSSSAYQWVDDLPRAFREARRVLVPGGRLAVAMFGRSTLDEFFQSLERAGKVAGRALPVFKRLGDENNVRRALDAAGFVDAVVTTETRTALFDDVTSLLAWLKGIGANGLAPDFFWGKKLLAATEHEYRTAHAEGSRLKATFEIIWIEAKG